jgi:putative transposase
MSSHVKNRALLHFVWTTSKRMPWIKPKIAEAVHRYIQSVAHKYGCEVLAVGGMPDHVHLFVCMSSTVSFAQLMQHVKGGSSYLIQHDLVPNSFFRWQAGYAIFGVSPSHKARVVAYIQNQEQHHREGSLWHGAEPDDEEPTEPE